MPASGDDSFQIVADLLPPVHKHAGTLELIQHAERDEAVFQGGEEFLPDFRHLLALAELGKIIAGDFPPRLQHLAVAGEGFLNGFLGLDPLLDVGLAGYGIDKLEIAVALRPKQDPGFHSELLPDRSQLIAVHFALRNAADEVGLHVLWLGVGRVVHVAADVQVVVVFFRDLLLADEAAVFRQRDFVGEDVVDFLDVLGAEFVLVLALGEFAVGIDEENLVAQGVRLVFVEDDDAGGNAGAVEQAGRQADDGLDHVVIDQQLADELFLAATEEDAVRHDGGTEPVRLEAGEDVLDEHEVRLFPGLRAPLAEA